MNNHEKGVVCMSDERHCRTAEPIFCPPRVVFRDRCVPRIVPIIHPIQIVERVHCVDIPHHIFKHEFNRENNFNDNNGFDEEGVINSAANSSHTKKANKRIKHKRTPTANRSKKRG
jgi:hypothetical protein